MAQRRSSGSGSGSKSAARGGRGRGAAAANGEGAAAQPKGTDPPSSVTNPVRAWLEANQSPMPGTGRDPFRVPSELVTQHTEPSIIPEKPNDSGGLFELVGTVARRALTLGLAAREPSFHVFVAAQPEVMI